MSSRFDDVSHVVRVVVLFALAVATFLAVRAWFVPEGFGVYGFYRAGALDDNRNRPLNHAGRAACATCHDDIVEARRGSKYEKIGCEACHGPLQSHAAADSPTSPGKPDPRATCVRCHAAKAGKPAGFPQVDLAEHAPEGACTECHQPHSPKISGRLDVPTAAGDGRAA